MNSKAGCFLTRWRIVSFSRIPLHVVSLAGQSVSQLCCIILMLNSYFLTLGTSRSLWRRCSSLLLRVNYSVTYLSVMKGRQATRSKTYIRTIFSARTSQYRIFAHLNRPIRGIRHLLCLVARLTPKARNHSRIWYFFWLMYLPALLPYQRSFYWSFTDIQCLRQCFSVLGDSETRHR
jgi:hypothetical protein